MELLAPTRVISVHAIADSVVDSQPRPNHRRLKSLNLFFGQPLSKPPGVAFAFPEARRGSSIGWLRSDERHVNSNRAVASLSRLRCLRTPKGIGRSARAASGHAPTAGDVRVRSVHLPEALPADRTSGFDLLRWLVRRVRPPSAVGQQNAICGVANRHRGELWPELRCRRI